MIPKSNRAIGWVLFLAMALLVASILIVGAVKDASESAADDRDSTDGGDSSDHSEEVFDFQKHHVWEARRGSPLVVLFAALTMGLALGARICWGRCWNQLSPDGLERTICKYIIYVVIVLMGLGLAILVPALLSQLLR